MAVQKPCIVLSSPGLTNTFVTCASPTSYYPNHVSKAIAEAAGKTSEVPKIDPVLGATRIPYPSRPRRNRLPSCSPTPTQSQFRPHQPQPPSPSPSTSSSSSLWSFSSKITQSPSSSTSYSFSLPPTPPVRQKEQPSPSSHSTTKRRDGYFSERDSMEVLTRMNRSSPDLLEFSNPSTTIPSANTSSFPAMEELRHDLSENDYKRRGVSPSPSQRKSILENRDFSPSPAPSRSSGGLAYPPSSSPDLGIHNPHRSPSAQSRAYHSRSLSTSSNASSLFSDQTPSDSFQRIPPKACKLLDISPYTRVMIPSRAGTPSSTSGRTTPFCGFDNRNRVEGEEDDEEKEEIVTITMDGGVITEENTRMTIVPSPVGTAGHRNKSASFSFPPPSSTTSPLIPFHSSTPSIKDAEISTQSHSRNISDLRSQDLKIEQLELKENQSLHRRSLSLPYETYRSSILTIQMQRRQREQEIAQREASKNVEQHTSFTPSSSSSEAPIPLGTTNSLAPKVPSRPSHSWLDFDFVSDCDSDSRSFNESDDSDHLPPFSSRFKAASTDASSSTVKSSESTRTEIGLGIDLGLFPDVPVSQNQKLEALGGSSTPNASTSRKRNVTFAPSKHEFSNSLTQHLEKLYQEGEKQKMKEGEKRYQGKREQIRERLGLRSKATKPRHEITMKGGYGSSSNPNPTISLHHHHGHGRSASCENVRDHAGVAIDRNGSNDSYTGVKRWNGLLAAAAGIGAAGNGTGISSWRYLEGVKY